MKLLYSLIILVILMITGCKKSEFSHPVLSRVSKSNDTTEYFYLHGKLHSKQLINRSNPYYGSTIQYVYTDDRIDSMIISQRYGPTSFVYKYHGDTLVQIAETLGHLTNQTFKYNHLNQVTEQTLSYFSQGSHGQYYYVNYLYRFVYRGGNIDTCFQYEAPYGSIHYFLYDTITYTYDNHPNPFSTQVDPDIFFFPYNVVALDFRYRNANNLTIESHTNPSAMVFAASYSYTYNADDYPTSCTRNWYDYYGNLTENVEFYDYYNP